MTRKGTILGTIELSNLELNIDMEIEVEIDYIDESGTYYDNDGSGLPSSLEWTYKIVSIYDLTNEVFLDHKKIDITEEQISEDLEEILINGLNDDFF